MRDVVFVVGMGRSGTSALTRVLSLCGAALPLRTLPANFANPTGYWEPQLALEINDRFLAGRASSWYDAGLGLQTGDVDEAEADEFIEEISAVLADGFEPGGPIVVKDPRISGLLPYWCSAAARAGLHVKIVHNFRRPDDVAASLQRRDDLLPDHCNALWLKYNLIPERDGRAFRRVFVSYEGLMRDWRAVAQTCIDGLDLGLRISNDIAADISSFLSPDLCHHTSPDHRPLLGRPPRLAIVYHLLKEAEAGRTHSAVFDAVLAAHLVGETMAVAM